MLLVINILFIILNKQNNIIKKLIKPNDFIYKLHILLQGIC